MTRDGTVRVDDPEYRWRALLFNAITAHPECHVLFSSRRQIAERLEPLVIREILHQERIAARRRRRFERHHPVVLPDLGSGE